MKDLDHELGIDYLPEVFNPRLESGWARCPGLRSHYARFIVVQWPFCWRVQQGGEGITRWRKPPSLRGKNAYTAGTDAESDRVPDASVPCEGCRISLPQCAFSTLGGGSTARTRLDHAASRPTKRFPTAALVGNIPTVLITSSDSERLLYSSPKRCHFL